MQETGATHTCPRCARTNSQDQRFCGYCGLLIDGLCPDCATQNTHSIHFCGNCGYDFAPDASAGAPTEAQAPAGNDLRSQSAFGPGTDPPVASRNAVDCPRCHHINEPGAAFCYNCGLPFDEATVSSGARSVHRIAAYAGAQPGGFWVRLVSFMIDGIVVTALVLLLLTTFTDVSAAEYFDYGDDTDLFNPTIEGFNLSTAVVYHAVLVGLWGATVGKRALGLTVLRPDGSKVGMWRAFGREAAKMLSYLTLFIGFIVVAFRKDKRSLHDLIANTVVVRR
jgi:uncharacterized RDD family membrane protein YckC